MLGVLASTAFLSLFALAAPANAEVPAPPGANLPCIPAPAHPEPVILVHGTFENRLNNWGAMSPALKKAGYCVFALNYGSHNGSGAAGVYALGPIEESARQLAVYVERVRHATGAARVDLVGHSQGGMMPRYYVKNLGGTGVVDDLVALSAPNHGTANPLVAPLGFICPACPQQLPDAPLIVALNSGDETPGGVSYTNIVTNQDEAIRPYTPGFLSGDRTTNITLQDKCPEDRSEHLTTPYDPPAIRLTMNALTRSGPADPTFSPECGPL